jgi:hypothetical protein
MFPKKCPGGSVKWIAKPQDFEDLQKGRLFKKTKVIQQLLYIWMGPCNVFFYIVAHTCRPSKRTPRLTPSFRPGSCRPHFVDGQQGHHSSQSSVGQDFTRQLATEPSSRPENSDNAFRKFCLCTHWKQLSGYSPLRMFTLFVAKNLV